MGITIHGHVLVDIVDLYWQYYLFVMILLEYCHNLAMFRVGYVVYICSVASVYFCKCFNFLLLLDSCYGLLWWCYFCRSIYDFMLFCVITVSFYGWCIVINQEREIDHKKAQSNDQNACTIFVPSDGVLFFIKDY